MPVDSEANSLDNILTEVGEFGVHQTVTLILLFLLRIVAVPSLISYMITATTLEYRCKVPECDIGENNRNIPFMQPWVSHAIPMKNEKLDNCVHYALKNSTIGQCSADTAFDTSKEIPCTEFIYATDERNIQTEFNIHCADTWKLAIVGSIGNIARFIFLPFSGLLSDRFGRLPCVILGPGFSFIFGLIKTFSPNYIMYIVFEFFEATAYAACFTGVYVYAVELMTMRYRVFGNVAMGMGNSVGSSVFGLVAMYVHDFRMLLRFFYIPGLVVFTYFWLLPESIRWLLTTGRVDRAINILKRTAKLNGRELSENTIKMIELQYSHIPATENQQPNEMDAGIHGVAGVESKSVFELLWAILKSKTLCLRLLSTCYQWVACGFCYYGLSQSSTQIPGADRYLSFVIVMCIEIPANILAQLLLSCVKRRILLFSLYTLAAVSVTATSLIPKEYSWAVLACFVVGKCSISIGFTSLIMYTSEQFPTSTRTTIMNTSAMVGRIGSMVAPFVVILGSVIYSLPALLFGGSVILAAFSLIFNPETFKKKLPDTIEDAKKL